MKISCTRMLHLIEAKSLQLPENFPHKETVNEEVILLKPEQKPSRWEQSPPCSFTKEWKDHCFSVKWLKIQSPLTWKVITQEGPAVHVQLHCHSPPANLRRFNYRAWTSPSETTLTSLPSKKKRQKKQVGARGRREGRVLRVWVERGALENSTKREGGGEMAMANAEKRGNKRLWFLFNCGI